jgi:hypothetical protein
MHHCYKPVTKKSMQLDDGLFFLQAELAPLDVWPKVVGPSQSATLAAPLQTCKMLVEFPLTSMDAIVPLQYDEIQAFLDSPALEGNARQLPCPCSSM